MYKRLRVNEQLVGLAITLSSNFKLSAQTNEDAKGKCQVVGHVTCALWGHLPFSRTQALDSLQEGPTWKLFRAKQDSDTC
jgi:hypothetical protein